MVGKVFTREFSLLGGKRVHTFGMRYSLLGSSQSESWTFHWVWDYSHFLVGRLLSPGRGLSLVTSRGGGGEYTARKCSHYQMWVITPIDSVSNGMVFGDSSLVGVGVGGSVLHGQSHSKDLTCTQEGGFINSGRILTGASALTLGGLTG